jgi:hypothetical protein
MTNLLDASEKQELLQSAIARYLSRELGEQEFRVKLGHCGLTASQIDEVVNEHRRERRKGTRFE